MKKNVITFICAAMLLSACGNVQTPQNSSSYSDISSELSAAISGLTKDLESISSSEQSQGVDSSVTMSVADNLFSAIKPQGEFMALSEATVKNFYTLPENTEYGIHVSASWTGEEIAVLKLENGKEQLITAAKERLSALKDSLEGYKDDIYAVVDENAVILSCGDYVALISGTKENVAAARAVLESITGVKAEVVT